MANQYKEFKGLHLPSIEKEMLERWEREKAFQKSVELREGAEPFVFYEGPPSANGMPGIHHVISRTLKDLVCRYKTMQGYKVQRKGGWDTHGLPVELGVEKELGITKEDIGKAISVADYNQKCREAVLRYKDKWDEITTKMGYWVDLEKPYVTFTNEYIESLWWCLKELYNKGFLYKSVSIQPYSPAAGTGLSSHELNQQGTYRNVKDTSATVLFKAKQDTGANFLFEALGCEPVFFMAWTTTPWTLPSNLGLTVGPNIDYVLVKTFNPYTHEAQNVVLAKALLHKYFKAEGENADFAAYKEGDKIIPYKIISEFKGAALENLEYEQLLPYEANSIDSLKSLTPDARPWRILLGDFVTTEDGTGIVHTAPDFGADDFKVGQKYNLGYFTVVNKFGKVEKQVLVNRQGKFVDGLGEFSGRYIKDYKDEVGYEDVNVDICVKLKKEGRAFKVEKYEHSYPHCWRTDKAVIYYPLDAWFIRTTAVKDRMVELNKTINWKPASTGTGRFGNWLENAVDWNLSRSRYWGTPLPIWRTEDGSEEICIGSIEELNSEIRKASEVLGGDVNKNYLHDGILDLHKPYVDEVVLVSPSGKPMLREPDLIDVWFDSGAMPYAQWHYPFGKPPSSTTGDRTPSLLGEGWGEVFPASFIAEGVDQTRGWFYTLHALAVMLFDSVAYKTVVSNGLVLDKTGTKMSKRLGNIVDPFKTIEDFGADATRWYLITNASPWDNLKFDIEGIKEIQRKFFGTLYNTYQFFALYANVDGFTFKEAYIPVAERPEIDRWILSSLQTLIKKTTAAFDDYEPTQAGRLIEDFVDEQLSNWYVRLCRRRFWKGEYEGDKIAAYQTLYECLETVVRLMAPISPFFSDELFLNLNAVTGKHGQASVHHISFPVAKEELIDTLLEERMVAAQQVSSLVLSLRKKVNIKVRQPLQKVLIPVFNSLMQEQLEKVEELIKGEVNIKEIEYLVDSEGFIKKKIRPNFVALGKKLGAKMKTVSNALAAFTQHDIAQFEKQGHYMMDLGGEEEVELLLSEVEITSEDIPGWSVASKGALTVALDINITPELAQEGDAREFVNRLQRLRKDNGFELTDRVTVEVAANNGIKASLERYNSYICAEILADKLDIKSDISGGTEIEVNDNLLKVILLKNG
ncbi:MAG: isoleucine-tRNA ligase [Flaviaesturariibacter sp.]|nr:isoleucine-tRNA ligase [Flaviaesturariibacter sp.]